MGTHEPISLHRMSVSVRACVIEYLVGWHVFDVFPYLDWLYLPGAAFSSSCAAYIRDESLVFSYEILWWHFEGTYRVFAPPRAKGAARRRWIIESYSLRYRQLPSINIRIRFDPVLEPRPNQIDQKTICAAL